MRSVGRDRPQLQRVGKRQEVWRAWYGMQDVPYVPAVAPLQVVAGDARRVTAAKTGSGEAADGTQQPKAPAGSGATPGARLNSTAPAAVRS